MRKKQKIYTSPSIRIQKVPKSCVTEVSTFNLQEQKERFLKQGKTPSFVVEGDTTTVEDLQAKISGKIRFSLLGEAEYILRLVKQSYGAGENYLEHIYGPRIEQDEANKILFRYMGENNVQESLSVYWSNEMTCSARMQWKGYSFKCNRPEERRYSLWLNGTAENPYLRRDGLRCLLDHEIGTHFFRSYNDGFQPWFYDRRKFGLRGAGSFEGLCTEEGLAAINTTLRAKENYLWLSALTYYTACKSTEMTFKQLFDHLGLFLQNPEQRWKHVMRVKRGLVDPNDLGGYGKDQCYFEGAVSILRNLDDINFRLLMSGKICYDEVTRVKRMARQGSVSLPAIMQDMEWYRKRLHKMATLNGLHLEHPKHGPSLCYLQRLKERQGGGGGSRRKKVRKRMMSRAPKASSGSGSSKDSSDHSFPVSQDRLIWQECPTPQLFDLCRIRPATAVECNTSSTASVVGAKGAGIIISDISLGSLGTRLDTTASALLGLAFSDSDSPLIVVRSKENVASLKRPTSSLSQPFPRLSCENVPALVSASISDGHSGVPAPRTTSTTTTTTTATNLRQKQQHPGSSLVDFRKMTVLPPLSPRKGPNNATEGPIQPGLGPRSSGCVTNVLSPRIRVPFANGLIPRLTAQSPSVGVDGGVDGGGGVGGGGGVCASSVMCDVSGSQDKPPPSPQAAIDSWLHSSSSSPSSPSSSSFPAPSSSPSWLEDSELSLKPLLGLKLKHEAGELEAMHRLCDNSQALLVSAIEKGPHQPLKLSLIPRPKATS